MIASALVNAGFGIRIEDGTVVVAFKGSKFEPYKLQRINFVDNFDRNKVQNHREIPPPLMKVYPKDKIEYWNLLTERALEHHQRLADNQKELDEQRAENRKEVLETVEEVWGRPRILTIKSLMDAQKKLETERKEQEAELRRGVLENKNDEATK